MNDQEVLDFAIIGSGPTGVTAARKLLSRGLNGKIYDAGAELPAQLQTKVDTLGAIPFPNWGKKEFETYKSFSSSDKRQSIHAGSKLLFGSDYVYADTSSFNSLKYIIKNESGIPISLSKGGFSNVWGGTFFPVSKLDTGILDYDSMQANYDFVSSFVPISGHKDDLEAIYPLPKFVNLGSEVNTFTQNLKDRADDSKPFLDSMGITFGLPRLALKTSPDMSGLGCQNCGLCAGGCVFSAIWSSRFELNRILLEFPNSYVRNFQVVTIQEYSDCVVFTSKSGMEVKTRKLILATGALATTLLLQTNNLVPKLVELSDTQVTLVPLLVPRRQKKIESGFVLSKAFMHVQNQENKTTDLSVQLIGYNLEYPDRLREVHPILKIAPRRLLDLLSGHLAVALTYQNMNRSGRVSFVQGEKEIIIRSKKKGFMKLKDLPEWKRLRKSLCKLGLFPFISLAQTLPVGLSFHLGRLTDDLDNPILDDLGRVSSSDRIHVVDGCALKSVIPGSITNALMANAARICDELRFE